MANKNNNYKLYLYTTNLQQRIYYVRHVMLPNIFNLFSYNIHFNHLKHNEAFLW